LCSGSCLSLSVDPQNCGACGNTCKQGGECSRGVCQVQTFQGERGDADRIVTEGNTASWMVRTPDATRIFRIDLTDVDAGRTQGIRIPLPPVYDLALTSRGYLYRTSQAIVLNAKNDLDATRTVQLATVAADESIVAFVATEQSAELRILYLVQRKDSTMFSARLSQSGDAGTIPQRFAADFGGERTLSQLSTNGSDAFFFASASDGSGSLSKVTNVFGGGVSNVSTLVASTPFAGGITFDTSAGLGWTADGVYSANRTGGTIRTLVRPAGNERFSALAIDEKYVFYLNPSKRALKRVSRTGEAPITVGLADEEPSSVALTSSAVLWVRSGSLQVLAR
jgi:hypothetical protein